MATADKHRWIAALAAAGLREIEVGSLVSPKLLPQMADTDEVARQARQIDGLTVLALAPNLKGAERGIAAGVHKLNFPVSASRTHSMANIRMTPEQAVEQVRQSAELCKGNPVVEVGISTAFDADASEDWVMQLAADLVAAGAASVGLSDTTGVANPAQVKRMFIRLRREIGDRAGAAHFHNTRGQGLANVVAALDAGVTTFDASQAGLGGCPYAPGASGNLATEDLLYLLEGIGVETGVTLAKVVEASQLIARAIGHRPPGRYLAAVSGEGS